MLENLEQLKLKSIWIKFSRDERWIKIRVAFLGKKGLVTEELKNLRNLSGEDKKTAGM